MYQTEHKKLLIDLFENNKEKSYSASYLVEKFSGKINKATIYRQLQNLEASKILRKTYDTEKETHVYQYNNDCGNHLHLLCANCGKIIHLNCGEANSFISHTIKEHEFYIDLLKSNIIGICKECYNG